MTVSKEIDHCADPTSQLCGVKRSWVCARSIDTWSTMTAGNLVPLASSTLDLPPGSYIYSIAQRSGVYAVISSDNSLRSFDGATLRLQPGGLVEKTHAGVTCLRAFDEEGNVWATAGRDGCVRCWDLRAGKKATEIRSGMVDRNNRWVVRGVCSSDIFRQWGTLTFTRLQFSERNIGHWIGAPHVTSKSRHLVSAGPSCYLTLGYERLTYALGI